MATNGEQKNAREAINSVRQMSEPRYTLAWSGYNMAAMAYGIQGVYKLTEDSTGRLLGYVVDCGNDAMADWKYAKSFVVAKRELRKS